MEITTNSRRWRYLALAVGTAGLIAMAGTAVFGGMSTGDGYSHVAKGGGSQPTTIKPTVTWGQTVGEPTTTTTAASR